MKCPGATAIVLTALATTACTTDAYCIGCPDAAARDARVDRAVGDAMEDAMGDACGPEDCNGRDDDCDGTVDEGIDIASDPRHCGGCGRRCAPAHAFPRCREGRCEIDLCDVGFVDLDGDPATGCEYACLGGSPIDATCDGQDDDCDGRTDEDVDLSHDPDHCGACGRACRYAHASGVCTGGACALGECDPGFHDLDGMAENGCEYGCVAVGSESCNGRDDDCDGRIDETLVPPATFCNPNGVCGETSPTCGGRAGWQCRYPATYEPTETRCDGLDNDCDGRVDEAFPLVGAVCSRGTGACRRLGTYVCASAGDAVICSATSEGTPASEECNGQDDDCDGRIDEAGADDPGTPWRDALDLSAVPHVAFTSGGRTVRIMRYEASRPDASATDAGSLEHVACSRAGVLPWTRVTFAQAQAACCALNPGGRCPGEGEEGWRLCSAEDWQAACRGPSSCEWSYATACTMSQPTTCNGREFDCDPATPADDDCLLPTGSSSFPSCRTDWGPAGAVYDLSGNAREWTSTTRRPGVRELRGGSYTSIEDGRRCGFSFAAAAETFSHPTTGFRCCHTR